MTRRTRRAPLGASVLVLLLAALPGLLRPAPAAAVTAAQWQPGYIISDATFYNSSALNAVGVQAFLNAKYQGCASGYTCMRDYKVAVPSRAPESGLCNGIAASNTPISAAQIIANVAVSCGINPEVLLVLIQKESGLITSTSPSYTQVTGYGCPDTTGCNTNYYGFFNQVYLAARQFKLYRLYPNDYGYVAGRSNYILYNPNTKCGGTNVYIQNQATAGLYIYTPYQPNAAALANLNGTGDSCSAYGNRNFWVYFNTWFGNGFNIYQLQADQVTWNQRYGQAVRVAVGSDGTVWVVNAVGNLYEGDGASWKLLRSGDTADVAVGTNGTIAIALASNSGSSILYSFDNGATWNQTRGQGTAVAVDSAGHIWAVASSVAGDLDVYNFSTWQRVRSGDTQDVSVGGRGVLAVSLTHPLGDRILYTVDGAQTWINTGGAGTTVSVGADASLWTTADYNAGDVDHLIAGRWNRVRADGAIDVGASPTDVTSVWITALH